MRGFALLPNQMSYLKIYPKRIIATLIADGVFEGVFTLHIEQYGLQANYKKCDVNITQEGDQWQIWVKPLTGLETPQFKKFTDSLNDYLFLMLKLTPNPHIVGLPKFEVLFDDIYFDLSGQEPVIQKIPAKNEWLARNKAGKLVLGSPSSFDYHLGLWRTFCVILYLSF